MRACFDEVVAVVVVCLLSAFFQLDLMLTAGAGRF